VERSEWILEPKSFRDPQALKARLARLDEPHIAPLTAFVDSLRESRVIPEDVPYFDPADGGIHARVLVLLEAPGSKAAEGRGSGLISANNNDETARNMTLIRKEANLRRNHLILWNVVPWYVGRVDHTKIRPVCSAEIKAGIGHLKALLELLPALKVIVTMGVPARQGWGTVQLEYPHLETINTWHPSPRVLNLVRERRAAIVEALARARSIAEFD
jgi:uracil-DNA glycosylase